MLAGCKLIGSSIHIKSDVILQIFDFYFFQQDNILFHFIIQDAYCNIQFGRTFHQPVITIGCR